MTLPNWGQYVAGEDTLQYYVQIAADIVTQEALHHQRVPAHEAQSKFKAAVEAPITGANFRGDATQGKAFSGQAFIPNALPGGVTP